MSILSIEFYQDPFRTNV